MTSQYSQYEITGKVHSFYKKFIHIYFFKFFIKNFIYALRKVFRLIDYLRIKKNSKLFKLIKENYFDNYNIPYEDIYFNYNLVLKKKPNLILELGCGYSTITFASALSKLNHGKLISLEQNDFWLKKTFNICNKIDYFSKSKSEIILSDAVWKKFEDLQLSFYEKLPECNPDIILVDGPNHKSVEGKNFMNLDFPVSGDVLNLENKLKIGTIIIFDGRVKNLNLIEKKLKRKYKKTINYLDSRNILELIESKLI